MPAREEEGRHAGVLEAGGLVLTLDCIVLSIAAALGVFRWRVEERCAPGGVGDGAILKRGSCNVALLFRRTAYDVERAAAAYREIPGPGEMFALRILKGSD